MQAIAAQLQDNALVTATLQRFAAAMPLSKVCTDSLAWLALCLRCYFIGDIEWQAQCSSAITAVDNGTRQVCVVTAANGAWSLFVVFDSVLVYAMFYTR
jgi:hypothetical protein